jgi:alkylation response protein AidB-like acyl-CoA dehydrogenase
MEQPMSDTLISLDDFRAEARSFLDANCTRREENQARKWGEGSDKVAVFEEKSAESEARDVAAGKAFRQKMFDAGFGWITGPSEYGGRALPGAYQRAYDEEASKYATPNMGMFGIGLGMVAPTFLAHGTEEAKQKFLRPMWRGEIVGCQLFSEPGAGSDLASLQAKAERDGDEWVITGQKVWTTGAQFSDVGEVICRTDPNLPKHKGLTGFIVDMKAPGVEVRPLRQMTGGASFNEVFFTEVRVPDSYRLGDVNQGWTVALTTLMNERASIGGGGGGGRGSAMDVSFLAQMLHAMGLGDSKVHRNELMKIYCDMEVARYSGMRAMAKIKAGQLPGPEMSTGKLALATTMKNVSDWVSTVLGPRMIADSGQWGTYGWSDFVLGAPGMRIAGGSDEVMRNILGERVLGLPKDTGIDSVTAFKDLKVGTQKSS